MCHCLIIDYYKCFCLPAEDVDFSRVDVKPECMDVDLASLSYHLVAGHILHLQQSVDHGQLVRHGELLVHVNIGFELGVLVEFVEQQRLPKLG